MLNIFKRSQNQIVSNMVTRIKEANEAPETAFKVELLMTAREDARAQLDKVERTQGDIALASMVGSFGGFGLLLAGITGTVAVLASPVFLAGAAVTALCLGTMFGLGQAVDGLRADRAAIDAKIMQDVKVLSDAQPAEAEKSVRYKQSLASFFNIKADKATDEAYAKVSARYAPKAAKSPKAASTSTSAPYYHDIH